MSMNLDTIYFDMIKQRKKLYETRVYDEKRQQIKLKDIIKFTDRGSNRTFVAMITELSYFTNFKDAIETVGLKKIMPNVRSVQDAVKIYENFPHSTGTFKTGAKKYGVLRMKFTLL
jgi:ASC-1-like (ASCH) protein